MSLRLGNNQNLCHSSLLGEICHMFLLKMVYVVLITWNKMRKNKKAVCTIVVEVLEIDSNFVCACVVSIPRVDNFSIVVNVTTKLNSKKTWVFPDIYLR